MTRVTTNKIENLRISDFISEVLVGFGIFFIIYSPFISFGDKNIESLGLFRFIFPAFSILVTVIIYQKTYILYYNSSEKRIYVKKPFSQKILESLHIDDLKEPKLSHYFEKKQFQFQSSLTKRKYKTIVRNKFLAIIKSWI